FKCGHDAPTYGLIDSVTAAGGGAYSALHDLDANRPTGSIKIRVKTYGHTLMLGQERLEDIAKKKEELAFRINQKKLALLEEAARRRSGDLELQRQIESLREQIQPILAAREA